MATRKNAQAPAPEEKTLVFIGWSGKGSRSELMAKQLRAWLGKVIQTSIPWMSSLDVTAGAAWHNELLAKLHEACFGILCVTPENYQSAWMNYEGGVLVGRLGGEVCPLLLELDANALSTAPLSRQQAKAALAKDEMLQLVLSINKALKAKGVPEDAVRNAFDKNWEDLGLAGLSAEPTEDRPSLEDKIDEILALVQSIDGNLVDLQDGYTNWEGGSGGAHWPPGQLALPSLGSLLEETQSSGRPRK